MEERKEKKDEQELASIPYFLYEDVACRFERSQKALVIVTIVALVLAIGLVAGMILMANGWMDTIHRYHDLESLVDPSLL